MFHFPRHAFKRFHMTPSGRIRRRTYLRFEELEARNLFSAGGLEFAHPALSVTNSTPVGYHPDQIRHAYGFDQINFTGSSGQTVHGDGSGQTIAIVDAYDDPKIFSDVDVFDKTFQANNNSASTLYQQYGASTSFLTKATPQGLPQVNSGWSGEISLDVEWAHAVAPGARILLVEAKTGSLNNLLSAVDYARSQPGVVTVSMSWGGYEFSGETFFDSHFTTPAGASGITFVAATGDSGAYLGLSWPAASPNVLAVGGTSLPALNATGTYVNGQETGWTFSGGGVSAYEHQPGYQSQVITSTGRTNPDVGYDANPYTGMAIYDTVAMTGQSGWFQAGGTSAGAPQWAALVAIADQGRALAGLGSLDGPNQTLPAIYHMGTTSSSTYFHEVTAGSNGYAAGPGYNLVAGLGSPVANQVVKGLVSVSGSVSSITLAPASAVAKATSNLPIANPKSVIDNLTGQNNTTLLAFAASLPILTPPPANSNVAGPVNQPVPFPFPVLPAPTAGAPLVATSGPTFARGGMGSELGLLLPQNPPDTNQEKPQSAPALPPKKLRQAPPQPVPAADDAPALQGQVWDGDFANEDWLDMTIGDRTGATNSAPEVSVPAMEDAALFPGLVAFLSGSWGAQLMEPKKTKQAELR